jgi:hypothetical protein
MVGRMPTRTSSWPATAYKLPGRRFAVDCTPASLVSVKILELLAPRRAPECPLCGWETSLFNALAKKLRTLRSRTHQ